MSEKKNNSRKESDVNPMIVYIGVVIGGAVFGGLLFAIYSAIRKPETLPALTTNAKNATGNYIANSPQSFSYTPIILNNQRPGKQIVTKGYGWKNL